MAADRIAESDDIRARLIALRDRLTAESVLAEGSALAAVSKELRAVLADLDALPAQEADPLDELADRRTRRRAAG